jgi:hypothetical protein
MMLLSSHLATIQLKNGSATDSTIYEMPALPAVSVALAGLSRQSLGDGGRLADRIFHPNRLHLR